MLFKFLALLCVVAAAAVYFLGDFKASTESHQRVLKNNTNQGDSINDRLKNIDKKRQLKKIQMQQQFDDEEITGHLTDDFATLNIKVPKGLDDRIDTTLEDVYNDLSMGKSDLMKKKLEDEVSRSLNQLQEDQELEDYEKELFIKSFIENAKRRGINIKIDEELNIYTQ